MKQAEPSMRPLAVSKDEALKSILQKADVEVY